MFLLRLAKGLVKGLLIGALIGWGVAAAGAPVMGPLVAYPMAALAGVVMALVAGKAIWEKDARIEVGTKALAGLVLAPMLMWVVQRFVLLGLPFDPHLLPGLAGANIAAGATAGSFAITALAMVAAVVGGFYDADHSGKPEDEKAANKGGGKRIEASGGRVEVAGDEESDADAEDEQRMRR